MATSLLTKLIRNQSRFESISQKVTVSHLTTASSGGATTNRHPLFSVQTQESGETKSQDETSLELCVSFGIYPSFSFQHFLNPVAPFAPDDGSNTIWADSVKKKRKKKMNKHKLKKLRKRLRRKTKIN